MSDREAWRDVNPREAGWTRVNAKLERDRLKADASHPAGPADDLEVADLPLDDTLVLFLSTPPEPTSEQLQIAAENAFRADADTLHRDGWEFSVRWAARSFTYHPEQCVRKPGATPHLTFATHTGWLAVDIVAAPDGVTETDRLNAVGRLLAELVIPEPVAVYRPATDESLAFTPDVEQLLREGRIGEAMVR